MKLWKILVIFFHVRCVYISAYSSNLGLSENAISQNLYLRNKRNVEPDNRKKSFIIEVALICDLECGETFQNDQTKILNYLLTLVLDLNMYYSSIRTLDLTFVVTSFTQINSTREQPFIENSRNIDGTNSISSILQPFGEWLIGKKHQLPEFDMGLLVTGSAGDTDIRTYGYADSLCLVSGKNNVFWGATILRLAIPGGVFCTALAQMVAHSMGHAFDLTLGNNHDDCWDKEYAFEMKDVHCSSPHKYFFSSCSEKSIVSYLLRENINCLVPHSNVNYSTYALNYDTVQTPSMTDQCKIQTNKSDVIIKQENCLEARCYEVSGTNEIFFKFIYPFVNTPCGNSGYCFRGRCLSKGYRIQNANNSNCLLGLNRFSYNDEVILSTCTELPTPFDRLMLVEKPNFRFYLATPYSTPDADENADKCLSVDYKEQHIVFDRCSESHSWFEWSLIKESRSDSDFILYHHHTKKCLNVDQTQKISLATKCNFNLSTMKWKIMETHSTSLFTVSTTATLSLPTERVSPSSKIIKDTTSNVNSATVLDNLHPLQSSMPDLNKRNSKIHDDEISRQPGFSYNILIPFLLGVLLGLLVQVARWWYKRNQGPTARVANRTEFISLENFVLS